MAENIANDKSENVQQDETPGNETQNIGVITLVLTADNHLSYTTFGQQPQKREERQQRLRAAFQRVADFAIVQGVDFFIQAGDLFDTTIPDERDRSFVAERLAQLKQAGIRAFAVGGVHDTPVDLQSRTGESVPAPQQSYARLGALHYFPPKQKTEELEPVLVDVKGTLVGICGLAMLPGQEGDPLAHIKVQDDIERAAIRLLVLHAPIEGLTIGSSLLDIRTQVSRQSIKEQPFFQYILAGYHHNHSRLHVGQTDVIVAGATQHIDFMASDYAPGFLFIGLAADGIRWCNHISVDSLQLQRLTIHTHELWSDNTSAEQQTPTAIILDRMRPLCNADAMLQIRLEGELTRKQYHQLDLNQIRRYGEEHCFALAIDDSALSLLPEQDEMGERFSPREELILLADEWISAATDEREKKALRITKEELLSAIDEIKSRR